VDDYRVTAQRHVNEYVPASGEVVRGWWVAFTDNQTGVADQVFVPDSMYPASVAAEIRVAIEATRAVHTLTG
jgi:hypothetical protein